MNRRRISSRSASTWAEVLVVIVIIGGLVALLLPAIQKARETARRMTCLHNLMRLGMGLRNYATLSKVFPPGTICSTAPVQPSNQYDVWGEAAKTDRESRGTSWILPILPYIEEDAKSKAWNRDYGVGGNAVARPDSSLSAARDDIGRAYCPTRRSGVRAGIDNKMLPDASWTGGGIDYGGCAGRHAAFTLQTGYNLCDATMDYEPSFLPNRFKGKGDDTPEKRWGIFGRVNVGTKFKEISDGLSYTIIVGELQRIGDISPGSKDGWAIGGPATLFTTGAMIRRNGATLTNVATPTEGSLSSNGFWGSPGSEHPDGANYGMADGSMRFISAAADASIFALLGSMADGEEVKPED